MSPPRKQQRIVTEAMIEARSWHRKQRPVYRVDEMAKFFFGMSASWMRLKLNPDKNHPETWFTDEHDNRMVFRRSDPEKASARLFWLSDVEPMAASLLKYGAITRAKYAHSLNVVQAQAALYELDKPLQEAGEKDAAE